MAPILGTLAAMLISMLTVVGFTAWAKIGVTNIKVAATAGQLVIVAKATQQYVQDNSALLATTATSATPVTVSAATLKSGGYLPSAFQAVNPYGQTWQAQVLQPSAGQLEALVTSTGGTAISDPKQLVQIAAQAGAQGGYVPYAAQLGDASMSASNAVGAFGGWSRAVAPFSNPGSGHLAALIAFSGPATNNSYLYRVAVAGQPQLNTMQTSLSMGGNDINAAGNVAASGTVSAGTVAATAAVTAGGSVTAGGAVTAGGSVNAGGAVTAATTMSAAGGLFNVDAAGRLGTGGYAPSDLPSGWGGGISTSDIYAHATIGTGTSGRVFAYMSNRGELMAANGSFLVSQSGVLYLPGRGSAGVACTISAGSSAITSDSEGVLMGCVGGVWRPVGGRQQKQQFYTAADGSDIPSPGCPATAIPQIIVTPMNIFIDNTAAASYTATGSGPWTVYIRDGANVAIAGAIAQVETYCAYP